MSGLPGAPDTGPLPPDTNRAAALIGVWWFYSALVIVAIAMRFWARIRIHSLGIDDWLMFATGILFIESSIMTTYYASIGGTRHLFLMTPEEAMQAIKFNWLAQPCAIFALATSKASVAFLVLRLLGPGEKIRRWILYFIIVTVTIFNSLGVVFTFVQCTPVEALWDHSIQFTCWDPETQADYDYFNGAWNVVADITLAVMPATFIMKLNMNMTNKIRLSILLGLGIVASVLAAVKVYYLSQLTARSDLTYITFDVMCLAGAELMLIVVCGSIPTMKPLYDHYWKGDGFSKWYTNFSKYGSRGPWLRGGTNNSEASKLPGSSDAETLHSSYSDGSIPLSSTNKDNVITVTRAYDVESKGAEGH